MAHIVPPYISKMVDKYEKEVLSAERAELKARKNLEFAQEYTKLCKEKLANAKKED